MANAIHLQATLDAVLANPKHWKQTRWHCGTSHCFAGFAEMIRLGENPKEECKAAMACNDPWQHDHEAYDLASQEDTKQWLGLSDDEWEKITYSGNSLERLQEEVCAVIRKQQPQETTE
jgi:hypothetical protein